MTRTDEEQGHLVSRRAVLAGAGAAVAAGTSLVAGPAAAEPRSEGHVGTARESQVASERGVECVADLR